MIKKIRNWLKRRRLPEVTPELYTREEVLRAMERAKAIGYNDGKRDGLTVAREQATKSLKEILWQQNQNQSKTK